MCDAGIFFDNVRNAKEALEIIPDLRNRFFGGKHPLTKHGLNRLKQGGWQTAAEDVDGGDNQKIDNDLAAGLFSSVQESRRGRMSGSSRLQECSGRRFARPPVDKREIRAFTRAMSETP